VGHTKKEIPSLKLPKQCPLVLLVEEHLREGKAFGSKQDSYNVLKYVCVPVIN
jgi:hypothetical protein